MASQQSQNIQTLLEAEKEAAKIVQQAREYRVKKLKEARDTAGKDIAAYQATKETEFRAFEASHAGTTSTTQAALDRDTESKLQEIEVLYERKKDAVVEKLLARATQVTPELHRNLKKAHVTKA